MSWASIFFDDHKKVLSFLPSLKNSYSKLNYLKDLIFLKIWFY